MVDHAEGWDDVARLLGGEERVLMAGQILKSRLFFASNKILVVTDLPRLLVLNSIKRLKYEINLENVLRVEKNNPNGFSIISSERTYKCEDSKGLAGAWVALLEAAMTKYKEDQILFPPASNPPLSEEGDLTDLLEEVEEKKKKRSCSVM